MFFEIRAAARNLLRNPGFTAVALATLAVAVGANSAIFSVVDGVLLRDLPYQAPDQLVRVFNPAPAEGSTVIAGSLSPQDFDDLRRETTSYTSLSAYLEGETQLSDGSTPLVATSAHVSGNFFATLGVAPVLGRALVNGDELVGADRLLVVSHDFWENELGSDPAAIGRTVLISNEAFEIVGVMPESFAYPAAETDLWMPISLIGDNDIPHTRSLRWMSVVGRLAPGISPEAAENETATIFARLEEQYPESNEGWGTADVTRLHDSIVGDVRPSLLALLGTVALVLLVACANLANLVIARGTTRRRESAARVALGASRGRLAREMAAEGVVLGVAGGAIGYLIAWQIVPLLTAMSGGSIPLRAQISPDLRVAGLTLILGIVTAIAFNAASALTTFRLSPAEVLREGGRSATSGGAAGRSRSLLIVGQTALALVLLAGAGLMTRTLLALGQVDTGLRAENVLILGISKDAGEGNRATRIVDRTTIIEQVGALPGVIAVGGSKTLPFDAGGEPYQFAVAGTASGHTVQPEAGTFIVTPGYFEALGIELRGETFSPTLEAAEVVINQTMAEQYWPNGDAIGSTISLGDELSFRVSGVAANVRTSGIRETPSPAVYVSSDIFARSSFYLFVRTSGDPMALSGAVREIVRSTDAQLPISQMTTLRELVRAETVDSRFLASLLAIFGGIALFLTALGVYGVTAFAVSQRTTEIGVRIALGASPAEVLKMVMGGTMRLAALGLALGVPLVLVSTDVLRTVLYEVQPQDPVSLLLSALVLSAIVLFAVHLPARRATRVSPTMAMRG